MKPTELATKYRRPILVISTVLILLSVAILIVGIVLSYNGVSSQMTVSEANVNVESKIDSSVSASLPNGVSADESFDTSAGYDASQTFADNNSVSDNTSETTAEISDEISEIPDISEPDNGVIDHGWVINGMGYTYVYGDAGYEQFNYKSTALTRYINSLNNFASSAPDSARLFNIIVPVSSTFADIPREVYVADDFFNQAQSAFVSTVEASLDEKITDIPIVSVLESLYDDGEYVFFRTDKNWTSAGAYAAYAEYCTAAGISRYAADSFPKKEIDAFLGSFYRATKSEAMFNNPDTIVCYAPLPAVGADLTVYGAQYVYSGYTPGKNNVAATDGYNVFLGTSGAARYEITTTLDAGRLLIIGDSSAAPLALLLSSHYSVIDIIDPAEYEGTLEDFLVNNEFDDILTICYTTNAVNGYYVPSFNKFTGANKNE